MTVDRMNELIAKWESQKTDYLRRMNKKIADMEAKRDRELATQMIKEFHRKNVSPQTVNNIRKASKAELERSFGNGIGEKNDKVTT